MVCCQTLVWLATISLAQLPPLPPLSGPASWTPPIGVPTPPFGINQQVPSRPNPWTATMAGWYYVDTFAPGATDSSNPNGYPGRPRRTIPGSLPAGSVVEVHGIYDDGGEQFITASGTATNPVYIRGQSSTQMPLITTKLRMSGRYLICENLEIGDRDGILSGGQVGKFTFLDGSDHIVFRRNDIHGNLLEGGIGVSGDYHVIWDNLIHDNGDWQTDFDQDCHGVVVGDDTAHLWIVDNELYRNSGDGVQVNAGGASSQASTHHIYIGRNLAWQNKQMGFWVKQAVDVIISQNTSHNHRPSDSSSGAGMGFQYAPERVWFLYNRIFDCDYGITSGGDSGQGTGQDVYYVGNVIYDIHTSGSFNPNTGWSNSAIMMAGLTNHYIVNNTIYDVDAGINAPANGLFRIESNIISNVTQPQGNAIFIESNSSNWQANNNVFWQNGSPIRVRVGSTVYTHSNHGHGSNNLNSNPQFVNPAGDDFHLQASSPAIDHGLSSTVYGLFQSLYAISILRDFDGQARPQGAMLDAGAYEYVTLDWADVDGDGDVDLGDWAIVAGCHDGPGGGLAPGCSVADFDGDGDVDLMDFAEFQPVF